MSFNGWVLIGEFDVALSYVLGHVAQSSHSHRSLRFLHDYRVIAKGYVIMLHGLNAHCNRPVHDHVSKQFSAHGYGFIALDFHGHGRSGEKFDIEL